MARHKPTNKSNNPQSHSWTKTITACVTVGTIISSVLVFYFKDREEDISNRFNDKLEFQKKDCERDGEERYLRLKLEVQTEYYQQVDEESETAKKLEKVFNRIDKITQK